MLKNFLTSISEGKYGKVVKEFTPAKLHDINRSALSFQVNQKDGKYNLILILQEDEGHEIEREFCNVDISCLEEIERLVGVVREFLKSTH